LVPARFERAIGSSLSPTSPRAVARASIDAGKAPVMFDRTGTATLVRDEGEVELLATDSIHNRIDALIIFQVDGAYYGKVTRIDSSGSRRTLQTRLPDLPPSGGLGEGPVVVAHPTQANADSFEAAILLLARVSLASTRDLEGTVATVGEFIRDEAYRAVKYGTYTPG